MAISDKALFGLTVAQRMEEENREAARMYGGLNHSAVRTDEEAVEYTAEIMSLEDKSCARCGRNFVGIPGEGICSWCARTVVLEKTLSVADRALREIGYCDRKGLRAWLAEHDPDGYYPNSDSEDLRIHVARRAVILVWEGRK